MDSHKMRSPDTYPQNLVKRKEFHDIKLLYSHKMLYIKQVFNNIDASNDLPVIADSPSINEFITERFKIIEYLRKNVNKLNRRDISSILDEILPSNVVNIILMYSYSKSLIVNRNNNPKITPIYKRVSGLKTINTNGVLQIIDNACITNPKTYNVVAKNKKISIQNIYEPAYTYFKVYLTKSCVFSDVWVKNTIL